MNTNMQNTAAQVFGYQAGRVFGAQSFVDSLSRSVLVRLMVWLGTLARRLYERLHRGWSSISTVIGTGILAITGMNHQPGSCRPKPGPGFDPNGRAAAIEG